MCATVRRPPAVVVPILLLLSALSLPSAQAVEPALQAGVGRSDITAPTGYYMQGWVRSDAVLRGVHTRIQNRAIVLSRGGQKLALVAADLSGVAGGVVKAAAIALAGRGFRESNIIVSASATHAAPSGYYNFNTYNTVFRTGSTFAMQHVTGALDPQLYAFQVRQLVQAITRADEDRAAAKVGWATTSLTGLTANRSLEAHLADHGISKPFGTGKVSDDPLGYVDTIDPEVQVLRVDKQVGGAFRTVGLWSTFADQGTVNKFTYGVYNADHHGAATRVVEAALRTAGAVPAGQDVVNAYGNTDEGDQSAGLTRTGPAAADEVGRVEAAKMLVAWQAAGASMTTTPELATRWTRVCFCGQSAAGGNVSAKATPGLPLFTGSEEGRGLLYDPTKQPFEGRSSPVDFPADPAQGHKIVVPTSLVSPGSTPQAVPLLVARVGERLIATVPGEMTVEMGRRVRASVLAAAPTGITGVQLSGLANEYLSYFVTPQEYDKQHYEGGSMLYGRETSALLQEQLGVLTAALTSGSPAPVAYDADPRNDVVDTAPPFGTGATSASPKAQPTRTQRLARASYSWQGGPKGLDMRLGNTFVSTERLSGNAWTTAADDQGLQIIWRVSDTGAYSAQWEVPRDATLGTYRFLVTANHYRLVSSPFPVVASTRLSLQVPTNSAARVRYPDATPEKDLTARPADAASPEIANADDGQGLVLLTGPAGAFHDAYGNCNGAPTSGQPGSRTGDDARADPAVCGPAGIVPGPVPGQVPRPAPGLGPVPGHVPGPGTAPVAGPSTHGLAATGSTALVPSLAALLLLIAAAGRRYLRSQR